jgi:hypothetical protein
VPAIGAYSFVLASPSSALCTLACALSTEAWAEGMLPAEDVVPVDPLEPDPLPLPLEPDPLPPDRLPLEPLVGAVVVVVCVVVVVRVGVVVVGVVRVGVVLGVVVVVLVGVVVLRLVWYVTNSVADELPVRLVLVAVELEDDASSAAVS